MSASLSTNRGMFWRIVRRLLFAHRARLFTILLALVAGATITAALLNLQVDAKRRLTSEFRAFGANIVISPRDSNNNSTFLPQALLDHVPNQSPAGEVTKAAFLYGVLDVAGTDFIEDSYKSDTSTKTKVILVGYTHSFNHPERVLPHALVHYEEETKFLSSVHCAVGEKLATTLKLNQHHTVELSYGATTRIYSAIALPPTGGAEDNQVFIDLGIAQELLGKPKSLSAVQVNVPGTPEQVAAFAANLQTESADATGRPLRQFTEAQAKIYSRISGLLNFTVAIVLILTALCVMAAMANVAMERRNDVGLMKAIGGARRRVLHLFLTEAVLLGLIGGLIGAAAGIALSMFLGKVVFGLAARPRLIVYPVAVSLTIIVAILSAYPLRHLASVRPASVFRGEA